jgi:guanylate kinase
MAGKLVVLSGPSGVGKDTLLDAWRARNPRVQRVVACTTRNPRPGEVDGVDYHFLTREEFLAKAEKGDFLEHKEVYGNFYATPNASVDALLNEGKIAILKIDVQGALAVKPLRPDALLIFILPPSEEVLPARITGRGTDSPEVIQRRLDEAHAEIAQASEYHHRVVNDDLQRAVDELEVLIR